MGGGKPIRGEVAWGMLEGRIIEDLNGVVDRLQAKADLQPEPHLHLV